MNIKEIQSDVANGNVKIAIEKVLSQVDSNSLFRDEIVLIKSRLEQANKRVITGTVGINEENIERNQIVIAFLEVLQRIAGEATPSKKVDSVLDSSEKTASKVIGILFVQANPEETTRLHLDLESREIEDELRKSPFRDRFIINRTGASRISDLQDALLNTPCSMLHFSGHGSNQGLILHGDGETPFVVNNQSICDLLKLFSSKIECVILNACYSEILASMIHEHIPNVIGMSDAIEDQTSIAFSKAFYKSIGSGKDVSFSFEFAKTSIGLHNLTGDQIPLMFEN